MNPTQQQWFLLPKETAFPNAATSDVARSFLKLGIPATVLDCCDISTVAFPADTEHVQAIEELLKIDVQPINVKLDLGVDADVAVLDAEPRPQVHFEMPESYQRSLTDEAKAEIERLCEITGRDVRVTYDSELLIEGPSDDTAIRFRFYAVPPGGSQIVIGEDLRGIDGSVDVHYCYGAATERRFRTVYCPDTMLPIGAVLDNDIWIWVDTRSQAEVTAEFVRVFVDGFVGIEPDYDVQAEVQKSVDLMASATEVLKSRAEDELSQTEERARQREKEYMVLLKEMRLAKRRIKALSHITSEDRSRLASEIERIAELPEVTKVVCTDSGINVFTEPISIHYVDYVEKEYDDDECPNCGDEDCSGCGEIDEIFDLGRFRIRFNFNSASPGMSAVSIFNIDHPDREYPHPHIASSNEVCFGNIRTGLLKFIAECELRAATQILINFLESYNKDDAYVRIERW